MDDCSVCCDYFSDNSAFAYHSAYYLDGFACSDEDAVAKNYESVLGSDFDSDFDSVGFDFELGKVLLL